MSNQSLFGFNSGALLRVIRKMQEFGQGAASKRVPATIVKFDNDTRGDDITLVSPGSTPVQPQPGLWIVAPGVYSKTGQFYSGSLTIGPSPENRGLISSGNSPGLRSICIQTARTEAAYLASGDDSIAIGGNASASSNYAVALGSSASASSSYAVALGSSASANSYAVALGYSASASSYAVALGYSASANSVIRHARATAEPKCQRYEQYLRRQTTGATPTVLTADGSAAGSSNQNILGNNSAQSFRGRVIAFTSDSASCAAWEFYGFIRRTANAASTVLVASTVAAMGTADSALSTASVALSADTTNGGLAVTATGVAATTINWTCVIDSELRAT